MGILDRVSTLLRANVNDMIDRAEDPEKVVKQLIIDMNNQLMQVKTQVAASIADEKLLYQRYQDNEAKASRLAAARRAGRREGPGRPGARSAGAPQLVPADR